MTPSERAQKSAAAMQVTDEVFRWFGMKLENVDEGSAEISMIVKRHHANGHKICHGGITYTLADTCFAYACNSRNQTTLAMNNNIVYLAPGRVGDTLTARATEVTLAGRNGIYDVKICNQDGTLIAEFRGMSRAIKGNNFDEETEV